MKNKYKNQKTVSDGHRFDSKAEERRYQELLLLKKANKIDRLIIHPKFRLQDAFSLRGRTYRAINYIADFLYYDLERDRFVVEDVKGVRTEAYILKMKLFIAIYGQHYDFLEIPA